MAASAEESQSGHALVVTKDKALWRRARKLLSAEGHLPTHCANVDEVRDSATTRPPAVIIVDADAVVDALETCREISALDGCRFIPLLLLSSDSAAANDETWDANVTAVLGKPISDQELVDRLQSLGDTGKTLSGIRELRPVDADLLQSMPDAFLIIGTDGRFRQYLGGATDDPVLEPAGLEGHFLREVWNPEAAEATLKDIRRVLKTRASHTLTVDIDNADECRRYEVRLLVQGRDRVLMIVRDLSSSHAALTMETERNSADTLTGLTARGVFMRHFEETISDAKLRERGIAVMCIDIDRFSRINETLGRAVGDAVLKVTAKRIQRCLRDYDQLARIDDTDGPSLTRISGDEFVLLLGSIESRKDVSTVAERVRTAFAEPIAIEGHQLEVSPSIGIAQYPLDGNAANELLKNARVALDEAKIVSANGHEFYSSTMKFRALKRFDVKNELRWAIEKDQLEIHFLPRIDLQTGHVAGLEALLRWIHPLRGSVPLSEVIPLAEATGLIFAIGEWVIRSTCRQAAEWMRERDNVPPVSVNLSQQEFSRDDLAVLVEHALTDAGLPPYKLELELTEGLLMRSRQADATIDALSRLGVGIVLDDFGQGHSSVAHLTSLPIKAIKIDRAFVDGVREPGKQQSICAAMIAMSRELGISVIAEGVESEIQVEFLRERGCDAVQGFLFTEPLPPGRVLDFLTACEAVAEESVIVDLDTVRKKMGYESAS